jgi:hypothetical protein
MGWTTAVQFPAGTILEILPFITASRPILGPTPSPMQGVPGLLPRGYSSRTVKLTTHLHLVPKLRICGAIPTLPQHVFMAGASLITGTSLPFSRTVITNVFTMKCVKHGGRWPTVFVCHVQTAASDDMFWTAIKTGSLTNFSRTPSGTSVVT